MRFTPAGIPVLSFHVEHRSQVTEAGQKRETNLVIDCMLIGERAKTLEQFPANVELQLTGFLANRSNKSRWIVFHVNEFGKVSGDSNESHEQKA